MNNMEQGSDKNNVTHTTHIGNVTGQVHTGSGNINVGSFTSGSTLSTKEELLSALHAFKVELETERQRGLPDETIDDAIIEIGAAQQEVEKDKPSSQRIVKRLENAKATLVAGADIAAAVTTVAAATSNLIPAIEKAIHAATKLFGV